MVTDNRFYKYYDEIKEKKPIKENGCICRGPLLISVPPGQTMSMICPVHGRFDIKGTHYTL